MQISSNLISSLTVRMEISPLQQVESTPAPPESSSNNPSNVLLSEDDNQVSPEGRLKTEAANPYIQFLMDRKKKSSCVLNMKKVNEEWKNISDEERNVFIEKYKVEKAKLGSVYREGRKRKPKKGNQNKLKKRKVSKEISVRAAKLGTTDVETEPDEEPTVEALLGKLEELEEVIDLLSVSNNNINHEISKVST